MTFRHRHLLGIEPLAPPDITEILDLAETYVDLSRSDTKHTDALSGMTQINMFFEASTRTQASFELAGKRLGADVMNMNMQASSLKKGETLIDTAMTLNAMRPDLLVVRHPHSGAVDLLAQKVNCAVLNAGDGRHEHPTQALLDALTIRRAKGRLHRLSIAICGDIAHSRVARSNILLLGKMENRLRLIGPPTLMPAGIADFGVEVFDDMAKGLEDVDVVMMLRLQKERMDGGFIPSEREYYFRYGLDAEKLVARQAGRHRHASRADEPRGGDRRDLGRRHQPLRHSGSGRDGRRRAHGRDGPAGAQLADAGGGMTSIVIPQGERGVVRVFALSLDADAAKALRENMPPEDDERPTPIEAALGATGINPDFVEVFPLADVAEIGLVGYLAEGNGIDPQQLEPDRRKLAGLEGWVLLVYSAAFAGRGATLKPAPELSLVGTYSEPGVDWTDRIDLKSDSAKRSAAPTRKPASDAAMSGRVAMIALLVMFLLTAVVIWIAA